MTGDPFAPHERDCRARIGLGCNCGVDEGRPPAPDFPIRFVLEDDGADAPADDIERDLRALERRARALEDQYQGFARELTALAELLRKKNAH